MARTIQYVTEEYKEKSLELVEHVFTDYESLKQKSI